MSLAPQPLLVRFGNLGDLVMLTPVARALAAHYGRPCVVLGPPVAAPLLAGAAGIDRVITFDGSKSLPGIINPARWRLSRALRAAPVGPAFIGEFDPRPGQWLTAAGIAVHAMTAATFRPDEHQIDAQFRLAHDAIGLPVPAVDDHAARGTALVVPDAARAGLPVVLAGLGLDPQRPWVAVHAGSTRTARGRAVADDKKHWPAARWAAVVRGILAGDAAMQVVLTGTAPERDLVAGIVGEVPAGVRPRVVNAAGSVKLGELLALYAGARGVVSVDTGPAHVAAAVGAPLVVLFGGTDPRVNAPRSRSSPVIVVTGPPGAPSPSGEAAWAATHRLADVTPAMVLTAYSLATGCAAD